MRTSSVKERDGEISLCVCTMSCILAYILYNFIFSSKLNSGIISQILCKPAYASSCLLTAPLLYLTLLLHAHTLRGFQQLITRCLWVCRKAFCTLQVFLFQSSS